MKPSTSPPRAVPARASEGEVCYPSAFYQDEAGWLEGLRKGQRAARAILFDRHAVQIRRLLARVLGHESELDDLLQDVFERAFRSAPKLRGDVQVVPAWLNRIAVYTARGAIRKRRLLRRFAAAPEPTADVPADSASPEIVTMLRRTYAMLERFPTEERLAITLRYIEGLELTEAAVACEVSLATFKRRLSRARRRLDRAFSEDPLLRLRWSEEGGHDDDRSGA